MAAFVCIVYAALVVAMEFMANGASVEDSVVTFGANNGIWAAIPVTSVSYTLHYNGPRYYQELKNRSMRKMFRVVVRAFAICAGIYTLVALCGYLLFGSATQGDILNNFDTKDNAALIARLGLAFVIVFTYPLAFHSLRSSVFTLGPSDWRQADAPRMVFP